MYIAPTATTRRCTRATWSRPTQAGLRHFLRPAPDVVAGNATPTVSPVHRKAGAIGVVAGVLCSLLCVCCCCFLMVCIPSPEAEEEEVIAEIIIERAPAQPAQSECGPVDPEYGAYAYTPNPLHSRRASLSSNQPPSSPAPCCRCLDTPSTYGQPYA